MAGPPFMNMWVGDYLADTGHLTTLQHGIYHLLIYHYWRTGGLPDDERQLASIARISVKVWRSNCLTIASLFLPGWKHKRIELELSRALHKREIRATSGRLGGLKTQEKNQANASADAKALLNHSSESDSVEESPSYGRGGAGGAPRKSAAPRATKLPVDFGLTTESYSFALNAGMSTVEVQSELEHFKDSARAKGRAYVDWQSAWKNWVRSPYRTKGNGNGHAKQHPSDRALQLADDMERALEREAYAARNSAGGGENAVSLLEWKRPA